MTAAVYLSTRFTATRTSGQQQPEDAERLADLFAEVIDAHYPVDHEDTAVEVEGDTVVVTVNYSALRVEDGDAQAQYATTLPKGWSVSATTVQYSYEH